MTKQEIAQQIEKRRKLLKVNQPELAELASISLKTLVNIETGKGNPTIEILIRVLDVLGLTLDIKPTKGDR